MKPSMRLVVSGFVVLVAVVALAALALDRTAARASRPVVTYGTEQPADYVVGPEGASGWERPARGGDLVRSFTAGEIVRSTGEIGRVQLETWRLVAASDGTSAWVLGALLQPVADPLVAPPSAPSPTVPPPATPPPTPPPAVAPPVTAPPVTPPTTTPPTTAPPQPVFGSEKPGRWDVAGLGPGGTLNVRSAPGTDARVVARLAHDAIAIPSTGKVATLSGATWRQVEYAAGKTGWVAARYLEVHTPAPPKPAPGVIVMGDWRGSGVRTPATFRDGVWYVRFSNTTGPADLVFEFGAAGDRPIAGDWNGDGVETPGVVRGGVWHLRNANSSGGADAVFAFGDGTPLVGDWNGDGVDTPGTFRNGAWALRNSNSPGGADIAFTYGDPGDRPVAGDWDGDGVDTPGVVRGSRWLLRNANAGGAADLDVGFGDGGDRPVAGDWEGDGVDAPGVIRGTSVHLRSGGGAVVFSYDPPLTAAALPR